MSAALAEVLAEVRETPSVVATKAEVSAAKSQGDPHPLVPVVVLGAIAFVGSLLTVATIVALLAIRGTGLDAAF